MSVSWNGVWAVSHSLVIGAVVMAQDPSGRQADESLETIAAEAAPVRASKIAQDFLADRGWPEGRIGDLDSFVAIGVWAINAPAGSDSFGLARRQAAQMALLDAKKSIATYLSAEVETSMTSFYMEGSGSSSTGGGAEGDSDPVSPGIFSKAMKLVELELDGLLRDRGVDPNDPDGRAARSEAAKQVIATAGFASSVQLIARQEIGALQAFRTFESIVPGSGGNEVACVVVYSPKSRALQEALLGRGSVSDGMAGIPISQWARGLGDESLLYTHGVQLRTDENGELNLVIFGQSDPRTESSRSQIAARDKAKLNAIAEARRFLGEMVYVSESQVESSSFEEYSDMSGSFEDSSEFLQQIEARADRLRMPGISWVYSWQFTHPLSELPTFGVVGKVSVDSAIEANGLRELFGAAAGSRGGDGIAGRSSSDRPVEDDSSGSADGDGRGGSGVGAEGEDPWLFGGGA